MLRILIVEDERAIADVVEFALQRAGFATRCVGSIAQARHHLSADAADLVVLDLGLPDGDGLDLCRDLQRGEGLPVLMLTCRADEVDRVVGLECGADDYMVKPFSTRELVARVRAILRRSEGCRSLPTGSETTLGSVTVRSSEHRVLLGGVEVDLTPHEFQVVQTLFSSPDRVFTREVLIGRVWSDRAFLSDRTVDSHIRGIRRKFSAVLEGADPVETVFGVGYRARKIE